MELSTGLAVGAIFLAGTVFGVFVSFLLRVFQLKMAHDMAQFLTKESEDSKRRDVEQVISGVRESFGKLSLEALSQATSEFLKLADAQFSSHQKSGSLELHNKKELIDQQLGKMTKELEVVSTLVKDLEKDRIVKFGELTQRLTETNRTTAQLAEVTLNLREVLSSSQARGQWGERIADDILRAAGFIEGVNYVRQKVINDAGSRPDFTFFMPHDLRLNMDVKFPIDNYSRMLQAASDSEKELLKKAFIKDIKNRIKGLTAREYINSEQNTVDCVLMFIPHEQVFAFVQSEFPEVFDEALKSRVISCSPMTLFAVLAVIRQAIDNFSIQRTSDEILSHLSLFKQQWEKFIDRFEALGKKIGDVQKEYDSLITTRRRQLERSLSKLDDLRSQKGLPVSAEDSLGSVI